MGGKFCEKATDESVSGEYRHFDMRPMRSLDIRPMSDTKLQPDDEKQNSAKDKHIQELEDQIRSQQNRMDSMEKLLKALKSESLDENLDKLARSLVLEIQDGGNVAKKGQKVAKKKAGYRSWVRTASVMNRRA